MLIFLKSWNENNDITCTQVVLDDELLCRNCAEKKCELLILCVTTGLDDM